MNSSKQSTQRRMLSPRNTGNSPRLAKLGARSPTNKLQTKKTQTRTTLKSDESFKDSDTSNSNRKIILEGKIPQRIIQNYQQDEIQFPNKDRYQGGINNQKLYGKGTYYFYQSNLKYVGQFYDNQFHGWGVLMKNYGNQSPIYQGHYQYGKKHGQGKYIYGPEHYYNGDWAHDMKDGKGIYFNDSQGLYNGQWRQNKKNGEGSLKYNDGTQYKGLFQNDQFVRGLIRYPNGDQYSGQYFNGKRQGQGSYFSLNSQQRYKGHWQNNKKHGRGITYFQNGDELQCNFVNGQIDETQSCTYKWNSGLQSGSVFSGWFKNGRPQKGHVTKINGEQYDTY